MSSSEGSDSDWKDLDKERGSIGADTSSPIFLENSCMLKKPMKPHDREKYPPVSTTQTEVLCPLDTSVKGLSLNSGKGSNISPTKHTLHHNLTSDSDHLCVVENIIYINFKTAKEESHANENTRAELLKMSDEKALMAEHKEICTGYDTSDNDLRGDPEGESTDEKILRSESYDSDDGYVTVRSRISVDSVALKKAPRIPNKFSHKKSDVVTLEAVYTNVPIRTGLIPQSVQSGDMATEKSNSEEEGDYCKLLPLGTTEEMEPSETFYTYTVRQVCDCFISCGLEQLADTCKAGKLDGAFFQHLMNENFSEILSKEPFNLTLLDTFKVKTIIRGWRPKVSIKKTQS
ncbi:hypothetical protein CHS0354_019367 [Potamilus streckersoni]|uniref:Uncharacterized protein n=1 Tax=Potamilus streckersoni TaxID=2493646 RepID=A0AAE0SHG7_9BIVA|nr:hypothetical protein CHS0354_019367 [Potamilus streckersoni]